MSPPRPSHAWLPATAVVFGCIGGWLYNEPDAEDEDPRGTPWELHPVTTLTFVSGSEARR